MKPNPLRHRLIDGQPCRGMWLVLPCAPAARLLARFPFDWFCIDAEHGPMGNETVAAITGVLVDAGASVLVRVAHNATEPIKRALDAGATGIIAPMIRSATDARALVAAAKFPPIGTRSLGSLWAGISFELEMFEYLHHANSQTLALAQIEDIQGLTCIEDIVRTPGLDGLFIGPVDLGISLRITDSMPESGNPVVMSAIEKILHAGQSVGLPVGIYSSGPAAAARRITQGFALVTVASDVSLLMAGARDAVARSVTAVAARASGIGSS